MTAGDGGSTAQGAEETAAIRRSEAAAAAKIIDAEYVCAGFADLAIFNNDESRRRVTELIRETRPDLVLTASPVDYHCDHEATSVLVRDACFASSVPNYGTATALPKIPHLYFMDSVAGIDRFGASLEPDFVVDVKSTFETKRSMLAQHASQRDWLKRQHGIDDYLATMERWTRSRGKLVGVEYGEGFRRYAGHPYPETPLLEQLLESKAIIHDRQWGSAK
jgi:LmbE family N-acetylglucosaminyl deacetylase